MAIAHLRVDTVSRATGGTAINAANYALGQGRHRRKAADVLARGHAGPSLDWRDVDRAEDASKRWATAKVARTAHAALPCELDREAHVRIAQAHAEALRQRHGVAVLWSIHRASDQGDQRNAHLHLVITTRRVTDAGVIGEKTRELDVARTSGAHIEAWRASWEQIVNAELAQAQAAARIDMRSFKRQGRADEPTRHLGPVIAHRVKKGYNSERHSRNDAILAKRHAAAALDRAERELARVVRLGADRTIERAGRRARAGKRCLVVATHVRAGRRPHAAIPLRRRDETLHVSRPEHRRDVLESRVEAEHLDPRGNRPVHGSSGLPQPDRATTRQGGTGRLDARGGTMGSRTTTSIPKMSETDAQMLARAKREVDLPGWFANHGWVADPERTSAHSYTMRGPDGSRVVVKRAAQDGHWTFFDTDSPGRSGTIYDAAKHYGGAATTGQQFRACRLALASPPSPVRVTHTSRPTATGSTPRPTAQLEPLGERATKYLTGERLLAVATIEAFRHALRERGGAAVARHNARGGEERGPGGWRSFGGGNADDGPGRGRSAWIAAPAPGIMPTQIIVAESYIDALSAWQMLPSTERATTALASTGGSLCPASVAKLARALERIPGATVLDASDRGERTTEQRTAQLRATVEAAGASYTRLEPPVGQKDWNDALRAAAVAQAAALMPQADEAEQTQTL